MLDLVRRRRRWSPRRCWSPPAACRAPQDLGLEAIGLTSGDWLDVDDTLRVKGYDWLYATGDVNHRALLTHQGKYQARAAGDVIAARARRATASTTRRGAVTSPSADHEVGSAGDLHRSGGRVGRV